MKHFEKIKIFTARINSMRFYLLLIVPLCISSCTSSNKITKPKTTGELQFNSANKELVEAFTWAKEKALSYAHDNSDPVGYWYEAALPYREAFCMRDVSHQSIGAEILGLGKHNYNMMLKFAQNISAEKDYCTYWEINRYDKPAPVDYETDKDFWYNLPSNFDVIFSTNRLYKWTGNMDYIENSDLKKFYALSLNEYIDHWELSSDMIVDRNRSMHLMDEGKKTRFGNNRGIPTYNEGGRGHTLIGIDMTASIVAAYEAYADILLVRGEVNESNKFEEKAKLEQNFLDEFWWDSEKKAYRSILYEDNTFDYFMVGKDQAFLHYLLYFDAIKDPQKINRLVGDYQANYHKLIVELKSYLPIIFYENGLGELANNMIIELCSIDNQRRDYPENSFTVIEHLTRGLMGVNVNAATNTFTTLPCLEENEDWAEMNNIPLLSNTINVKHNGRSKTSATNVKGKPLKWLAQLPGAHKHLYVDGIKTASKSNLNNGSPYSYSLITLKKGQKVTVSITP